MTVNTVDITDGPYLGNDLTVEFSYNFRIENKNQLKVYDNNVGSTNSILLVVDTDYTVSGLGVDGGGIITMTTAPATGRTVYIRSNYLLTQDTDLNSQGGFFPDVHESSFDKLTFISQQLSDRIDRAATVSENYAGTLPLSLPIPNPGKILRWNGAEDGLENVSPSDVDITTVITQDLTTTKDTIAAAKADDDLVIGSTVLVSEFTVGNPINRFYKVVASGTGTEDNFIYHDSTTASLFQLEIILDGEIWAEDAGWFNDGTITPIQSETIAHYCRDNNRTLNFKGGTYDCTGSSIKSLEDKTFHWKGDGQYNTFIGKQVDIATYPAASPWLIDGYIGWGVVNEFNEQARRSEFILEDLSLQGDQTDEATPAANLSQGVRLDKYFQVQFINVGLRKFYVAMQTGLVLWSKFQNVKFYRYIVGWQGDGSTSGVSQNNTFDSCLWDRGFATVEGDGTTTAHSTAIIAGTILNDNTFLSCTWEARGHIKTIDMSQSNGNLFLNPRIEQLNNHKDNWLSIGNRNTIVNMLVAGSTGLFAYSPGTGYSKTASTSVKSTSPYFGLVIEGDGNNVQISDISNLDNGVKILGNRNKLSFPSDALAAFFTVPPSALFDEGAENVITFDDGTERKDGTYEKSPFDRSNAIDFSVDLTSSSDFSNVSLLTAEPAIEDPFRLDKTFRVNAAGNHYWAPAGMTKTIGNIYTFSIYMKASDDAEVPMWLFANSVLRQEGAFKVTTEWTRMSYSYHAGAAGNFLIGFSTTGVAETIYISYPQIEDRGAASANPATSPAAFLGTAKTGAARTSTDVSGARYATTAPTIGTHGEGDELLNVNAQVGQPAKYECTVGGSPGTWEPKEIRVESATTTSLNDIAHVINTSANKIEGRKVYNSSLDLYVVAAGNANGSVWVYEGTGNTAHTPV
jgi:hypothetical protein